jgi:hypothetical protein
MGMNLSKSLLLSRRERKGPASEAGGKVRVNSG